MNASSHLGWCMAQSHYEVAPSLKRAVRGTLRRMVDAGRLQSVPNHANLFRLGGVVRQVSQEAGIRWPRSKPGSASLDPRVGPPCSLPAFLPLVCLFPLLAVHLKAPDTDPCSV